MQAQQFWDQIYADLETSGYRQVVMADAAEPSLSRALAHFGDLQVKTLVDLAGPHSCQRCALLTQRAAP